MKETFALSEINKIAKEILFILGDRKVIAFEAEMGAGKTTTIATLCKLLGISTSVSSPTFSIINEYGATDGSIIYHLDLYRIKDKEEAVNAGVEEAILSGNICFIEWPKVITEVLPADTMHISLKVVKDGERLIEIK